MSFSRSVAFYAPLKSPNHPTPSGERTMARLLFKALTQAGFSPHLASELRTLDKRGERQAQEDLKRRSEREAARLITDYRALPRERRPRLWFTYHVYYKAPDWIGPAVADALDIPYVVTEGSRALKRAEGPWSLGHEGAEAALDRADLIFVMTAQDRPALEAARPAHQELIDLPPFLNAAEWSAPFTPRRNPEPRLLTVAMMREGDKLASYRILATALGMLMSRSWTLDIVGDGEARSEVERLFAPLSSRIRFQGVIEDKAALSALYGQADLVVWPAVNEAYGMALLEAQLLGLPVVAGAYGGVASVVLDGVTGLLTAPGDAKAFARAIGSLLDDDERRHSLGLTARRFVLESRTLDHAAQRIRTALSPLIRDEGT